MQVVGITGTNGKTTTTCLLESICAAGGSSCGVIGTIHSKFAGRVLPSSHTTPDPLELHEDGHIAVEMRRGEARVGVLGQNGLLRAEVLHALQAYFGCGSIRPDRSDKTLKWETLAVIRPVATSRVDRSARHAPEAGSQWYTARPAACAADIPAGSVKVSVAG